MCRRKCRIYTKQSWLCSFQYLQAVKFFEWEFLGSTCKYGLGVRRNLILLHKFSSSMLPKKRREINTFQQTYSIKIGLFISILPLAENLHFLFWIWVEWVCTTSATILYIILPLCSMFITIYIHTYIHSNKGAIAYTWYCDLLDEMVWFDCILWTSRKFSTQRHTQLWVFLCIFQARTRENQLRANEIFTQMCFISISWWWKQGWARTNRTIMVANCDASLLYMPLWCWFKFHLNFSLFVRLHNAMREQIQLFTVNGLKISIWLKSTTDLEQMLYYHYRYYSQKPSIFSFLLVPVFLAWLCSFVRYSL